MSEELNDLVVEDELVLPVEDTTEEVDDNTESKKEEESEPVKKDKIQARINKVIRERHELQRANEELQKRLEGQPTNTNYSPEVIESLVREQAAVIAEQNTFNNRCNSIFEDGSAKYPEFNNSVTTLNSIGLQSNPELFKSIVDTDNASDIIEYLANNLDEAEMFMDYSPAKMIRELTKLDISLAGSTAKVKPVSKVPAPIKPVSGKTAPVKVSAETNPSAWIAQRNRELASKRK